MKQMNVWFEDKEHEEIYKAKELHKGNWHDFLLDLAREYLRRGEKNGNKNT